MRTETKTVNIYTFNELSEAGKATCLEQNRSWNVDFCDWHSGQVEFITEAAALLGIHVENLLYTGFYIQGSGACIEGDYEYKNGAYEAIKLQLPNEGRLQSIALQLNTLQSENRYLLTTEMKHNNSSNYYHSGTCTFNTLENGSYPDVEQIADDLTDLMRQIMDWAYSKLQEDYEYLTSDACIIESLEANEMEFLETGEIYN